MIGQILSWLLGGGVAAITKSIQEIRKAELDAKNTTERIKTEKEIATLEARRLVLVAEAKSNWNVAFRAFMALPFVLFVWKTVGYDKILGWGSTDNLSPELWNLMMVVYGFYFVYETAALFKR